MTQARPPVLYHNPRCTKSREALALLRARGVEPEVILYLESPPSVAEVERLLRALGGKPSALLRTREEPYRTLGLSEASTAREVAQAIAANPILLERPVFVVGDKAVVGRPPERVLELLP